MNSEKYIGYLALEIANTMWPSGSLFREVGIATGIERRNDFPSAIFFYVDCRGSAVDKDCKGYAYSETPLTPVKHNLDLAPGVAFEPLSRDWYLFRDGG